MARNRGQLKLRTLHNKAPSRVLQALGGPWVNYLGISGKWNHVVYDKNKFDISTYVPFC